jgi:hypothetical protein
MLKVQSQTTAKGALHCRLQDQPTLPTMRDFSVYASIDAKPCLTNFAGAAIEKGSKIWLAWGERIMVCFQSIVNTFNYSGAGHARI